MGIRNLNKGIFFFLIAFIFVNHTQSQTDFIIHKVRKNQDIEKIAMIYEVDVNIILEFNQNIPCINSIISFDSQLYWIVLK